MPNAPNIQTVVKYRYSSTVLMSEKALTIPEIMLIGGTRVALGVGLGLLIADKLSRDEGKGAGWALLPVGVVSTVPLVMNVLGEPECAERRLGRLRLIKEQTLIRPL
jgi:hypothetical protein